MTGIVTLCCVLYVCTASAYFASALRYHQSGMTASLDIHWHCIRLVTCLWLRHIEDGYGGDNVEMRVEGCAYSQALSLWLSVVSTANVFATTPHRALAGKLREYPVRWPAPSHWLVSGTRVHWRYPLRVYREARLQEQSRDAPGRRDQEISQEKRLRTRTGKFNTRLHFGEACKCKAVYGATRRRARAKGKRV